MRTLYYFVIKLFKIIVKIFKNRFLQIFLPGLVGAYYLCLDIWGSDWLILKNYADFHQTVFFWLIGLTVLTLFFRGIIEHYQIKSDEKYLEFLEGSMILAAKVVNFKLERFKSVTKKLTQTGNTFKKITQPEAQIKYILQESKKWISDSFDLKEEQICITIIGDKGNSNKIYYVFDTDRTLNHTKASDLIKGNSAARDCYCRGEVIFHADKEIAAEQGSYFLSTRDQRTKKGSIYCYPAFTTTKDYEDKYIISISTYGKFLCNPLDEEAIIIVKTILKEICRRLDLELTLYSIKEWQFNNN